MASTTEPTDVELRSRIRAWMRYYRAHYGWSQRELAQALSLSEPTISNLIRNLEDPGLDCFVRMHFRLGADLGQMVRRNPPELSEVDTGPKRPARK